MQYRLGTSLLGIILIILFIPIGIPSLAQYVNAQTAIIETSAETHDDKFFGEDVIQITITDLNADNNGIVETTTVNIDADSDTGSGDSVSIIVPETSKSSGRFEFFLTHVGSGVNPADLDSDNSAGVEGDGTCAADCAPFVTFGTGGEIDTGSSLYEDVRFTITAGNEEITVNYEETIATLTLDRSSYGSNSFVYIFINDQDANLNPTGRDEFSVSPDNGPNDDLFELNGGEFIGDVTFEETGSNTGLFKGRYQLGSSIDPATEALVLTIHEKANYNADLDAPENDSNNTDEVSFTIGNNDGTIEVGDGGSQTVTTWDPVFAVDKESYAPSESVRLTVTDNDANTNFDAVDSVKLVVSVSSTNSQLELSATETGIDTAVFGTTFVIVGEGGDNASTADAIEANNGDTITIKYTDKHPADYSAKVASGQNPEKDFTIKIPVSAIDDNNDMKTTINMTEPTPKDSTGNEIASISSGQRVMLSTVLSNTRSNEQPFVAIVEVRNSDGLTIFLAWQTGIINPNSKTDLGLSWTPSSPGEYFARTFAISQFANGEVLSPVAASVLTVGSS